MKPEYEATEGVLKIGVWKLYLISTFEVLTLQKDNNFE